ncbi:helix-turn-helix domain-containing protein [Leucobacter iarius]|uniref:HTH araC/xylS-type domain-containing protein n=1 Tax=Leucobacter iarius TaxID=333963 RepID=A0ABN2LRA7_9MICO
MTGRDDAERGTLFPSRLPEFHRVPAPPAAAYAMRWIWIPEWDLTPGEESRQEVLPFPAGNLVIESEGSILVGPPTRRSERVLRGRGWAVGALLRPAAQPTLLGRPAELRDRAIPLTAPGAEELRDRVVRAMTAPTTDGAARRAAAAALLIEWITDRVPAPAPGSDGALANHLAALVEDPSITRVEQLAERMHLSVRSLQRLADRFLGVPPLALIRRRRLQEAAQRLRDHPELRIADLAIELGYADHAHFTGDFVAVLGRTPSVYRRAASDTGRS